MNDSIAPSKEDVVAFYETQMAINPDAANMGLPHFNNENDQSHEEHEIEESIELLDGLGEALDTPEFIVISGHRVMVGSPVLDDLINLFKMLRAEADNLEQLASKTENIVDHLEGEDLSALLRTAPAARAVFLRAIDVDGMTFADDDEKWTWYAKKIDALSAIELMDMFMERTDWPKLIGKVRRIMGKLQGLAGQVRQKNRKG